MATKRLIGCRMLRIQCESIEKLISTSLTKSVKAFEGQSANLTTVTISRGLVTCNDAAIHRLPHAESLPGFACKFKRSFHVARKIHQQPIQGMQPGCRHAASSRVLLGQNDAGLLSSAMALGVSQPARNFSIFPWSKSVKDDSKDETMDGTGDGEAGQGEFAASLPESESSADSLVQLTDIAESAALAGAMEGAWLPTRTLQWALESVHNASGLPWWQSIMLTTLGIRAIMLPVNVMQIKNTYRLSQARPEIEHLIAHMKEEQARGNPNATAEYQQQVMKVWTKYNANPLKSMATIFIQAPLFIGFFSALRGLAAAKVPSLVEGGTLWFHDLTVADTTYALPLIASGSFLLMIELNAADGMQGQPEKMRARFKNIMRGVAVLIVPFTVDLPAAVFMYWSASNLISLVQSSLLKRPSIKKAFGIPTLTTSGAPESPLITEPGKPIETFSSKPRKKSKKQAKSGKAAKSVELAK